MFELIFHPDAQQEILDLDSAMQGKVFAALDKLESQGNQLRYPHTDIIQDGRFELRAGKKDMTRTFLLLLKEKKYISCARLLRKLQGRHRQRSN